MCVCDKCNDFVFHYLLDYSCRALIVDSVLFLILEKTVDFIQCMCVENSFALVSFAKVCANQVQHLAVVLFFFLNVHFSKLLRYLFTVCAPFYRAVFLFRRVQDDYKMSSPARFLLAQSAFPCI